MLVEDTVVTPYADIYFSREYGAKLVTNPACPYIRVTVASGRPIGPDCIGADSITTVKQNIIHNLRKTLLLVGCNARINNYRHIAGVDQA